MGVLACLSCNGSGRKYASRYGGNDPDVWDSGSCEECEGRGDQKCQARRCNERAVALNDDGEALCEDCLSEWVTSGAEG